MHIPAFLNQRCGSLPVAENGSTRCIVADNGIFLERRSPIFTTSIRVNLRELELAQHDEYYQLMCGKIPRRLQLAMLGFFNCAHALHGGEAALVLLYHPQRKCFRWYCPEQIVDMYPSQSGWSAGDLIEYQIPFTLPNGFLTLGDAHLHEGPPTPSSIDVRDDQDGLHIIVGTIRSTPTYNIDFVMDGVRFRISPDAIFEDAHCPPIARASRKWLSRILIRTAQNGFVYTQPLVNPRRSGTKHS